MKYGLHPVTRNVSETGTGHGDNCSLSGGVEVECTVDVLRTKSLAGGHRVSFVGIRISADPEHPWVTRSTVHGLCEEFPHRNMAAVAVHEGHEINRSHTRWQKFTVVLFSGSLWLRREAQSSARCPVQTP